MKERSGKGSHIVIELEGAMSVIPQHREALKPGTLRAILKQLRITTSDLEE